MTQSAELADLTPPTRWVVRGLDGPVRETSPVGSSRSTMGRGLGVTIELSSKVTGSASCCSLCATEGRRGEMPRNMQRLKEQLEGTQA